MKRQRLCGICAGGMLAFAALFFAYAVTHPEASFPWSNTVTWSLYAGYFAVTALLFAASVRKKRRSAPRVHARRRETKQAPK